jgi:hypothetical protein
MAVGIPEMRPPDMALPLCVINFRQNNPGSVPALFYRDK